MYELLRRSSERPWGTSSQRLADVPLACGEIDRRIILHMQENRSQLSREARLCFSMLSLLFMVAGIAPALTGQWLVPAFSLLAMAALTFALERHAKSRPASEILELDESRIRHRDSEGRTVEYPTYWMRLTTEAKSQTDLRLFLRSRDGSIEFGRCLSLDERHAVVPLVAAALVQARGL